MHPSTAVKTVKTLLYVSALTFLIVAPDAIYPFVTPKAIFYRTVIELALVIFASHYLFLIYRNDHKALGEIKRRVRLIIRNPLFIAIAAFLTSALLSTVFAVNVNRAFFGNLERGEGFWGLLHYGIFLFLGLLIFKKDDWVRFAKILLVAVFVLMAWSWLQFSDLTFDSLANKLLSLVFDGDRLSQLTDLIGSSFQPGSFIGNPGSLSGSVIISLGVAAFLYFTLPPKDPFRYGSLVFAIISIITIFTIAIRGAIIGLAAGLFFLALYGFIKSLTAKRFRKISLIFLIFLVLFSSGFWLSRGASLWQSVPGLDRLSTVSLDISSVSTRLIALGVSWDAFLEKPVFGWGPENYNIAYNKHYNPAYSYYAEDWFDRAHNKVAGVSVTQGGLGLILYLGLFVSLFFLLFKRKPAGYAFVAATVSAYFIQNLFLFDNITSYISFFTVIGMSVSLSNRGLDEENEIIVSPTTHPARKRPVGALFSVLVVLGGVYSLYAYNFLPWYQATEFINVLSIRVGEKILDTSDSFLYPDTFAQKEIRAKFAEVLYDNNLVRNENFKPLIQKSVSVFEEAVRKEPYDPRDFILLSKIYNELSKDDISFANKSEEYIREAIKLSPNNQSISFTLAVTLAGMGRNDEAVELARQLVASDESLAKAHYQLALVLALIADKPENQGTSLQVRYQEEAKHELDITRELAWGELDYTAIYYGPDPTAAQAYLFKESDLNNMVVIYRAWGEPEKEVDVLKMLIWLNFWYGEKNVDYYYDGIRIYRLLRDKEGIISIAEQLKLVDPSLVDELDVIIDLAEKEKWNILDTL